MVGECERANGRCDQTLGVVVVVAAIVTSPGISRRGRQKASRNGTTREDESGSGPDGLNLDAWEQVSAYV